MGTVPRPDLSESVVVHQTSHLLAFDVDSDTKASVVNGEGSLVLSASRRADGNVRAPGKPGHPATGGGGDSNSRTH